MKTEELRAILDKHEKWLRGEDDGERANLSGANLRGVEMPYANLYGVCMRGVDMCGAKMPFVNLFGADMRDANISNADMSDAILRQADMENTNLCGTCLRGANMQDAYLRGSILNHTCLNDANLSRADLRDVDLYDARFHCTILRGADLRGAKNVPHILMRCPDSGSFIGWKRAGGLIVKLLIPEDARRSSATGRKCRCDKAKVIALETLDGKPAETNVVNSDYDKSFVYEVGKTVEEPNFCEERFYECAPGIHFFINRQEAVDY